MNTPVIGALIGLVLFFVFERKRIAKWRAKFNSRRPRHEQRGRASALAQALAEAGFFENLTEEEARELRKQIETLGYGGVFSHPWRSLDADDEELAEGQVGLFLQSWAPSLERLGVRRLVGVDRFEEGGAHLLDLEGETLTLVSLQEIEKDGKGGQERFAWGAVAARLFERMNRHLAAAGKSDRFYAVYGGNDGRVLILTPAMLAAIMSHTPDIRRDALPYIRTAERPNFGMPTEIRTRTS